MSSPHMPGQAGPFETTPAAGMSLPTRREFLDRLGKGLMVWVVLRQTAGAQESEAAHPGAFRPKSEGDFNAS